MNKKFETDDAAIVRVRQYLKKMLLENVRPNKMIDRFIIDYMAASFHGDQKSAAKEILDYLKQKYRL